MNQEQSEAVARAKKFLNELTELSLKYGVAIAGNPILFLTEPEDRQFSYLMDEESRVTLG